MRTKVRFWQELQPDGTVANSWIRLLSLFSFVLLCIYLYFSMSWYKECFRLYTSLLTGKSISEQTYITLTMQLKQVDELVFWVLVLLTAAPKVVQKFAETWVNNKAGFSSKSTIITTDTQQTNKPD